jgi:hypothetical protein
MVARINKVVEAGVILTVRVINCGFELSFIQNFVVDLLIDIVVCIEMI